MPPEGNSEQKINALHYNTCWRDVILCWLEKKPWETYCSVFKFGSVHLQHHQDTDSPMTCAVVLPKDLGVFSDCFSHHICMYLPIPAVSEAPSCLCSSEDTWRLVGATA